ncbi:MAG: DUF4864 domain-containing protein [Chlamydiales bacterium]|nr:DUF4864 domain-containing protein [Chlamydiia bacterium]MCP5507404.1 DUF4864 domain-containing protein [Chlamydiales bacterium]
MSKFITLLFSLLLLTTHPAFGNAPTRVIDSQGILETIDGHVLAIRENNLAKAYGYTSRDYRRNTSFIEFQELVKLVPVLYNNKSISMQGLGEKDGSWIYCGTLTSNSGDVYNVEYYVVKENKKWRIMGMYLQEVRK